LPRNQSFFSKRQRRGKGKAGAKGEAAFGAKADKRELLLLEVRPELRVSKKEVNQEPRALQALPSRRASRKRNSVKSVVRVITKSSALLRHSV